MKNLILMLAALPFFILSCGTNQESEEIMDFIPGTYARQSEGEFGKSYDTLVISLQNKAANQYKIVRRWRYDRVLDGKTIEPEYKVTETSAVFDAASKALQESETLDAFTFDTKKKLLFDGPNQFIKIK
jgi:predicted Ser/Thr protein kinase